MKLVKMEIQGFKSFHDRVKFVFNDGINTIVGPNGCGKSNVVDAIRWSLGEQSASRLRGRTMQDILFNGSDTHGPVSMSEVILTFINDKGAFPPQFILGEDVNITRRMFRNGENEYFINKTPSIQRHINDLFLGSGVGSRAYSIIEQGKIGTIINAKPHEIRSIIEDAAGITRYKKRKEYAVSKMESTKNNLIRLVDVLGEIEKRMRSLKIQAGKAKRFKEYKESLKNIELSLASSDFSILLNNIKEFEKAEINERKELLSLRNEIDSLELDREAVSIQLEDAREQYSVHSGNKASIIKKRDDLQNSIKVSLKEIEMFDERILDKKNSLEQLFSKNEVANEKIEALNKEESDIQDSHQTENVIVDDLNLHLKELRSKECELSIQLKELRDKVISSNANCSRLESAVNTNIKNKSELVARIERYEKDEGFFLENKNNFEKQIKEILSEKENLSKEKERLLKKLEKQNILLDSKNAEFNTNEAQSFSFRDLLSSLKSEKTSLSHVLNNLEGSLGNIKSLGLKDEIVSDFIGTIADIIEVNPEYETSVESLLGERIKHIVTKSNDSGIKSIKILNENKKGRRTFISKDIKCFNSNKSEILKKEGLIPVLNYIKYEKQFENIVFNLFGNAVISENIEQALERAKNFDYEILFVTAFGDIVNSNGVLTGGKSKDKLGGLLRIKRQIKEKDLLITKKESEYTLLKQKLDLLGLELKELKKNIESSKDELHNIEKIVVKKEGELNLAEREKKSLEETISLRNFEKEQMKASIEELKIEEKDCSEKLEIALEQKKETEKAMELKNNEVVDCRNKIDVTSQSINNLQVKIERAEERKYSIKKNIEDLKEEISNNNSTREDHNKFIENSYKKQDETRNLIAEYQDEIELLSSKIGSKEIEIEKFKNECFRFEHKQRSINDSIKSCKSKESTQAENLKKTEFKLQELSIRKQNLSDHMFEKYSEILLEYSKNNSEAIVNVLKKFPDNDSIKSEIDKLKKSIEKIGSINPMAIEEFQEVEERFNFLSNQKEDLEDSIKQLEKAINKINITSRTRFKDTFDEVNGKFIALFPKLFNGGKAKLVLSDEKDMLHTGIEIVAEPPGKKLQSVNLLSGGEKALTAVSLIFAIFLIKPSPFCILDEVDAPLDDANIDRFNEMLQSMTDRTQFLIITHNKRTMEMSDSLYGITMEEPGVSKMVSVKLTGVANKV